VGAKTCRAKGLCGTVVWFAAGLLLAVAGTVDVEGADAPSAVYDLAAKETLTALEMDHGDTLRFCLKNGEVRTLVLQSTAARILERVTPGGIVYAFTADVTIDGHPMTLHRYVCSQECFYEPYVVNGMRVWLDTVRATFDKIPMRYPHKGNLQRVPRKAARLAVQDARLRVCPQEMRPWYPDEHNFIDVGRCYNGDDCWMGPYLGQACHGGMDINHPKGDPLFAPIDIDDHFLFNSLKAGHNNNRWRGIRRWPNGDVWAVQTHHLIRMLVPEHRPLKAGTKYATTAGVHVGSHQHTHWEFKVAQPGIGGMRAGETVDFDDESEVRPMVIHLDPWILFRQIFEDRKARRGELSARMEPLSPARTGEAVRFVADEVPSGRYHWTFGDGGFAKGREAGHTYARPGIYAVTLTVAAGGRLTACTQHVTVDGDPLGGPALVLACEDEPRFRPRPLDAMDAYGVPPAGVPHTLSFVARASRPRPAPKTVMLVNVGAGTLPDAQPPVIRDAGGDWLAAGLPKTDEGRTTVTVSPNAEGLTPGVYEGEVVAACPGALNSPQSFRVEMDVRTDPPATEVTVDDRDEGFYATPYFWVGHQFCRCKHRGYADRYLTSGGRKRAGAFVRFTPDLAAGRYEIRFADATPFRPAAAFDVRVRHAGGESVVSCWPHDDRRIGTFAFHEGTDGFVEIHADAADTQIIADAVTFRRIGTAGRE
jgi:hypothetical protein